MEPWALGHVSNYCVPAEDGRLGAADQIDEAAIPDVLPVLSAHFQMIIYIPAGILSCYAIPPIPLDVLYHNVGPPTRATAARGSRFRFTDCS